jgi:hypothetical protein
VGRWGYFDDRVAGDTRLRRLMLSGIAAAAAVAVCAVPITPAHAGGGGGGARVIAILPDTSAVELSGYPAGAALQVDVRRHGVRVGSAGVTADGAGDASVNAGAAGCWTDATPDIRPGDTVKVSGSGLSDTADAQAVTVDAPVQTAPDTVEVHGTATASDGTALPLAGLEARITGGVAQPFSAGRPDLRAGAGQAFPLVQDAADATHWTATFAGLRATDVAAALTADVRAITTDLSGDQTIAQAAGARGPAAPCSAPGRRQALTESSRAAVNVATAGDDLTLSGVAEDADGVTVALDDDNPDTPPVAVPATLSAPGGAQSFTATIAGADLGALSDGTLTATVTCMVGGSAVDGAGLTLRKDTVAPDAPTATPGPGSYGETQAVALEAADPTATIHWTAGAAAPTADSPVYTGPIAVSETSTLRAVAVDAAGNVSPVGTFPFDIIPFATITIADPGPVLPAVGLTPARVAPQRARVAPLRLVSLAGPGRISARRLRANGLRLVMRMPAEAVVVHVAVYRRSLGGARTGEPVAAADRLALGANGVLRMRLHGRSFRRLRPGRYIVDVRLGRGQVGLGPAASLRLTVTR